MSLDIKRAVVNGLEVMKSNPMIFFPIIIGSLVSLYPNYAMAGLDVGLSGMLFKALPLIIIVYLVSLFTNSIVMVMAYNTLRKKPVSLVGAAKTVLSKIVTLMLASIIVGALSFLGLLALIIPGIFLAMKFSFYPLAVLIDNGNAVGSVKRSWRITKGNWWRVLGLGLLFAVFFSPVILVGFLLGQGIYATIISSIIALAVTAWYVASVVDAYIQLRK